MRSRKWVAGVSLVMAGATVVGFSPAAWAAGRPTIVVTDPGGDNGPYITGQKFTPGGQVTLTEWAVGTKKPYEVWSVSADGSGNIASYGFCDGNNQLVLQALNVTTHKKSKKSTAAEYPCIN